MRWKLRISHPPVALCLWILTLWTTIVSSSQPLTVLSIGAIDSHNSTSPGDTLELQTINYTAIWGEVLQIQVTWSSAGNDDQFMLLQQIHDMITNNVDFLVLNDIFYGILKSRYRYNVQDTTIVHYQSKVSPFVSSQPAKIWPSQELPLICGTPTMPGRIGGADGSCNEDENIDWANKPIVPSKIDVVFSVVERLGWDSLVLLCDYESALEAMDLSTRLSSITTKQQVYKIDQYSEDPGLYEMFNIIYTTTITSYNDHIHIVILCSDKCVNEVMKEANSFDFVNGKKTGLKMKSKWLVVLPTPNSAAIEECGMDMDNIAVLTYPPGVPTPVYDMKVGLPKTLLNVLKMVGDYNDTTNFTDTDIRKNASDTLVQLLESQARCWRSELSTLLWKPAGVRVLSPVGYVNRTGQLVMQSNVEIFPNIKFGFNQRSFKVSTEIWAPFVKRNNETLELEGFCLDLLKEIAASLNFSYTLELPPDREWGIKVNGSFTGLIGQLEREEVDMIVAPISIQREREQVMDFIFPFFYEYTTVLIKMPDPMKTKWRTLIDPFKWEVLLTIGAALLFVTAFYFLLERWNPYYEGRKPQNSMFGDAFWYMYGALLTQGGEHLPDSQAGRTIVSCWWLFSIVMAATYSGNLIAFLTVNKDKLPFETLNEMVHQNEYIWGTAGGGTYWMTLFQVKAQTSNRSEYRMLWDGIQNFNTTDTDVLSADPLVHKEKVKQGMYAYIADRSMMEIWMTETCDLRMIKENFSPLQYAIGFPNNSAYTKTFSEEMLRIYESGLLQIWKKRWWPKMSFCKGSLTTEAKPISLVDVQSAFYLIGVGVTIAGLALGSEWLFKYVKFKRKPPPNIATTNGHSHQNGHLPYTISGVKA